MTFELREATRTDAQAVAELLTELGYPTKAEDVPGRMNALLAEGGAVFLAVDGMSSLGLMCLARHVVIHSPSPVAYITALVTTQSARRRGVGRAFVDAAKTWAIRNGCVRISVTSAEHRSDAHAFYPACGLPYTGRRFSASVPTPGTSS